MTGDYRPTDFETSDFEEDLVAYVLGLNPPNVNPLVREVAVNEFADGCVCEQLYSEVYDAKLRLFDRLRSDDDKDVAVILKNMEDILERVARIMYHYGLMDLESEASDYIGMDDD